MRDISQDFDPANGAGVGELLNRLESHSISAQSYARSISAEPIDETECSIACSSYNMQRLLG